MSTVTGRDPDIRPGRCCLLCGSPFKLQLIFTASDGTEFWQCENTQRCAEKTAKRDGMLADWPCHHAEHTDRVTVRQATDLTWREWHQLRHAATGDEQELVRMERHPVREREQVAS